MNDKPLIIKENVFLKDHCTFGIGGPARYFVEVRSIHEMQEAIAFSNQQPLPFFILGKGSNCLFEDRGFPGVVILNKIDFMKQTVPGTFYVGAGYSFALLGVQSARQGWGGLEFASGIPASVGGAVFMNAGANGSETSTYLESVEYVHGDGQLETFTRDQLSFSYRHSPFQQKIGAIVAATFKLPANNEARKRQIEIVTMRKNSQPYDHMSAGCVFLNPQCGHAGALIDRCGLKGKAIGDAQVSEKHANFLINIGNASCKDMLNLIQFVKEKVKQETGAELKSEVRYIPYE